MINVEHANYTYAISYHNGRYVATCRGKCKYRQCADVWINDLGKVLTDDALIAALEQGVKAYQRREGRQHHVRTLRANGYVPPVLKPGRVMTPREKRQNGRAE